MLCPYLLAAPSRLCLTQVYYVQQADRDGLEVTLAGRQFTLSKGAFMHVPPGAAFKIRNLSDDRAAKMIFFIVMVRARAHPEWLLLFWNYLHFSFAGIGLARISVFDVCGCFSCLRRRCAGLRRHTGSP